MCVFQERSTRCFVDGAACQRPRADNTGRRDLVTCITWHVDGLNSMFQSFSMDKMLKHVLDYCW